MTKLKLKRILFNAYLFLPGTKYLFLLVKKFLTPKYKWRKFLRFHGVFTLVVHDVIELKLMSYGNTIENELFWLGSKGWEYHATKAWARFSKHSSVIFDVGANTGLYSLISAKANPKSNIYAFEPLKVVFSKLNFNTKLNDVNVNAFNVALADDEGPAKIFAASTISDTFDQASLNPEKYASKPANYVMIEKRKLTSFIEEHDIRFIDLMKIDVETFEPQVLSGMGVYLKQFEPTILIEILNTKVGSEIERLLAGTHYQYYLIDERKGYIPCSTLTPYKRGSNFILLNPAKHGDLMPASITRDL